MEPMQPIHPLQMLGVGASKKTFYVVFSNANHLPLWFRWVTRKNFEHCFVMAQAGIVCCAVEQSNYAIMQHTYWDTITPGKPLSAELLSSVWAEMGYTVIKFETAFSESNRVWNPCNALPTCVNLCKNLLGVSTWIQSPYGFYLWLLKNGGSVVKGDHHGR